MKITRSARDDWQNFIAELYFAFLIIRFDVARIEPAMIWAAPPAGLGAVGKAKPSASMSWLATRWFKRCANFHCAAVTKTSRRSSFVVLTRGIESVASVWASCSRRKVKPFMSDTHRNGPHDRQIHLHARPYEYSELWVAISRRARLAGLHFACPTCALWFLVASGGTESPGWLCGLAGRPARDLQAIWSL